MLGETIFGFFEEIGFLGLLIAFAVISFFDGLAIPTLPPHRYQATAFIAIKI